MAKDGVIDINGKQYNFKCSKCGCTEIQEAQKVTNYFDVKKMYVEDGTLRFDEGELEDTFYEDYESFCCKKCNKEITADNIIENVVEVG